MPMAAILNYIDGSVGKDEILRSLLWLTVDNKNEDFTPTICAVPHRLSKRPSIVKSESNVRRQIRKRPDPPCIICEGNGKVNCSRCQGRGRTNFIHLAMLPKGEWPKWCKNCGGSGLMYCSRCLGTGEYREMMGFHFLRADAGTGKNSGPGKQ